MNAHKQSSSRLYTIGYATKPLTTFVKQLKHYAVDVVADVRSVPYSKVFKDYDKEHLAMHLRHQGIRYVFLGEELGPRSKNAEHYDNSGQVQFDRLMKSALFRKGVARLNLGLSKGLNIALMCAEKDPMTCHRSLLIAYYLQRFAERTPQDTPVTSLEKEYSNTDIHHICHHGELESQIELESRMSAACGPVNDLFMTEEQCREHAYKKQLQATSYRMPVNQNDE